MKSKDIKMNKQTMEYRFIKRFAPQIGGVILPPDVTGDFGWDGYFKIKPKEGIEFITSEKQLSVTETVEKVKEMIKKIYWERDKKDGEDLITLTNNHNMTISEVLQQLSQLNIKQEKEE